MFRIQHAALAIFFAGCCASASLAQTAPPTRPPPQVTTPPMPQLQLPPAATVRPNAPATAPIPVYITDPDGVFRGSIQVRHIWTTRTFPEPDHDGDGVRAFNHGGTDCDDSRADVAPGRFENPDFEGKDEDCDITTVGNRDADRDGFVSWQAMNILRDAGGNPIGVVRGPDCDDSHADTNPNMPEVIGDLRDNNCDGYIDVIDRIGHDRYCAPTNTVTPANALLPCGAPRGDLTQLGRR